MFLCHHEIKLNRAQKIILNVIIGVIEEVWLCRGWGLEIKMKQQGDRKRNSKILLECSEISSWKNEMV